MTKLASQLVRDLRRVMEPHTAARLRERHANSLRDYMSVAGPLGVSHFLLLTQTDEHVNLRVARFPQGPTLCFRVLAYALQRDLQHVARPAARLFGGFCAPDYTAPPLVVLNNFHAPGGVLRPDLRLMCSTLQGLFPTVNTATVRLTAVRRVVLFHHNRELDTVELRHYAVRLAGAGRGVARVLGRGAGGDLGAYADVADFVLRELAAGASDSEADADSTVAVAATPGERRRGTTSQRAVHLAEVGPRLTLQLVKVLDGFCAGKTLHHISAGTGTGTGTGTGAGADVDGK